MTDRRSFLKGAAAGAGTALVAAGLGSHAYRKHTKGGAIKPQGFPRARPIAGDTDLPEAVDVAIIGGGFVGVSTALALAERGVSVAVFEKGVVAGEASGRSGGLVESQLIAPEKMELIEYSKRRWRTLNQLTQEDTTFMERGGISSLFLSADDVGMAEGWLDTVKSLPNGGARILTADQAAALAPGATRKLAGGIISETDGTAEPAYAAPAIALGARKHGARIYQWCAVRGIERTNDAVSGVITERGRVRASTVVLATGLWSPLVAHGVGLDLPMVQLFAQPVSVHPFNGPDYGVVSIIGKKVVGWRKQPDGGYILWQFDGITPVIPAAVAHYGQLKAAAEMMGDAMMPRFNPKTFWRWRVSQPIPLDRPGPFEATRIYEPEMRVDDADEGLTNLQAIMPVFERLSVRERWCGAMEMTTDNLPVISRVGSVPGLIIATGCLYGLTMGPGIGLIVADLATNRKPEIDIAQFRYERFTDGSKLTFHA